MINVDDLTRDEFNKICNEFSRKKDYDGLVNYMRSIKFNNIQDQIAMNNYADGVASEGAKYKALMNNANANQRSYLKILEGVNSGFEIVSPRDYYTFFKDGDFNVEGIQRILNNPMGGPELRFSYLVNQLGGDGEKLKIRFNNKERKNKFLGFDVLAKDDEYATDGYQDFVKNMGLPEDSTKARAELEQLGFTVTHNEKDGTTDLDIDKTNLNNIFNRIFPALRQTAVDDNYRWNIITSPTAAAKQVKTTDVKPMPDKKSIWDRIGSITDLISGPDDMTGGGGTELDENVGTNGELNRDIFNNLVDIYDKALDTERELMGYDEDGKRDVLTGLISKPIAGVAERELLNYAGKGQITRTDFEGWLKYYNDKLDNKLAGASYSQFEVYGNDDEHPEDDTLRLYSDEDKQDLKRIIQNGLQKNAIKKSFANLDGEYGMLVTILPYKEGTGENAKETNPRQFFIKGFYNDAAQRAFERDTSSKAVTQLGALDKYHGTFDTTIKDGPSEYIVANHHKDEDTGNDVNDLTYTRYYTDEHGIQQSEVLNRIDALNVIKKKVIANDAINTLSYFMQDPNGNYMNNPNIMKHVDDIVTVAMQELYPEHFARMTNEASQGLSIEHYKSFFEQEMNELKYYILKQLNL